MGIGVESNQIQVSAPLALKARMTSGRTHIWLVRILPMVVYITKLMPYAILTSMTSSAGDRMD